MVGDAVTARHKRLLSHHIFNMVVRLQTRTVAGPAFIGLIAEDLQERLRVPPFCTQRIGTANFYGRQLLEPCLTHRPPTAGEAVAAQKLGSGLMADDDPFPKYFLAGWYSLCGQPDLAYPALRRAIAQNYCAYPQMEIDPLLAKVRAMPAFAEIRSLGTACQQRFLEHRKQSNSE